MAYTFIVLNTERTDKGSKTFTIPRMALFLIVFLVMFAPSASYYIAYYIMAPNYLVKEAKVYKNQLDDLQLEYQKVVSEKEALQIDNEFLKVEGATAREQLGEISTRIEIAEKARSTTSDKVQELEQQKLDLERQLAFYEKFVTPDVDDEILQCFNISVRPDGKNLKYGINFLKKDQGDKKLLKTTVRMKVLYGSNILNLTEDNFAGKADREVKMNITKDRRLTGSLTSNVPKDGLHILDIKAYDKEENIIAHCWKPF